MATAGRAGAVPTLAFPTARVDTLTAVAVAPPNAGSLAAARAAFAWRAGDPAGVVDALEGIEFTRRDLFPEADRAAYLLASAYRARGENERFVRLARLVDAWPNRGPYGDALAFERLLAAPEGEADRARLLGLATADTTTRAGRDHRAAGLVARAGGMLERGEDPRAVLAQVPATSRFAARALHLAGLVALEKRDSVEARRLLTGALAADSTYAEREEIAVALGGEALARGAWSEASALYGTARVRHDAAAGAVDRLLAGNDFATLWGAWQGRDALADEIAFDLAPVSDASADRAWRATDGTGAPSRQPAAAATASAGAPSPAIDALLSEFVPPPSRGERDTIAAAARAAAEAAARLDRTRRATAAERARLSGQRDYLAFGTRQNDVLRGDLSRTGARLDSLEASLDATLARLVSVRDRATKRFVERAERVLALCRDQRAWIATLRRLHVDGPARERAVPPPPGHVDPDSVTLAEDSLAQSIDRTARELLEVAPARIARSFDEAWRPALLDRTRRLAAAARDEQARAAMLAASLERTQEELGTSNTLRALETLATEEERERDAAGRAHATLRDAVARAAALRAKAALAAREEGLDYGLAAAAYGAWVTAVAADSTEGPATAVVREEARTRARAFLARHGSSPARGEMRFHLADVELAQARQDFRARMAAYVAAREAGTPPGPLPTLDHDRALVLYRAILAEDPGFAHRDAVLYNAGIILTERGDPEAEAMFAALVTDFPGSSFAQEGWLRRADLRFDAREFAAAIPLYDKAAAGTDARLRVIALYKKAWASFNEDRFLAAAAAFRAVLDEYARARMGAAGARSLEVDVEAEAESYLVHSLARAGGADAFAATFTGPAHAAYEPKLLLALGQHFRGFSLYAQAIAADSLFLERHGDLPEALVAAERQAETCRRWNQPALGRRLTLAAADRFAPGSAWARAVASDSLRTAGARFTRTAWLDAAVDRHRATDWREALSLEERLLAAWPDDAQAPRWRLLKGEAHLGLGDEDRALAAFDAAAASGKDSIPEFALARKVAVLDAAYENTRRGTAPGDEAKAKAVLDAGDALLARAPVTAGAADVRWRQGHLALAHGWYERAALDFGRLATAHPNDRRAPDAAALKGDAYVKLERYDLAGGAYEEALVAARAGGRDSLAKSAAAALPLCAYRHAELLAAGRDSAGTRGTQAERFAAMAARFPDHELAPVAQYRAGQAWLLSGDRGAGVRALETLIARHPKSELARDAHLAVAAAEDSAHREVPAAAAYERFARAYADDADAGAAWLRAAALYARGGRDAKADSLRLAYPARHPADVAGAMEGFEAILGRELDRLGEQATLGALDARAGAALAAWRARVPQQPALASPGLIAHVRFLEAEDLHAAYAAVTLTLPLKTSIAARQKRLEPLLAKHRACVDLGVAPWTYASAFRIGEALAEFGDALTQSERPADLAGDDLTAYDDVVAKEARTFYGHAERAWSELLAGAATAKVSDDEPWLTRARAALWPRLAQRFLYRPEFTFPAVEDSALLAASRADFAAGRHADAIDRLEGARATATPALLLLLALHYDAADRATEAGAVLAEALGAGASGGAAEVFLRLRGAAPERATGPARQALKADPENAVNINNEGIVRLREGDRDGAQAAFEKAIERAKDLPGPYYNLAILAKFYRFDGEAASCWFARYRERASEDPDGLATALGGDGARQANVSEVGR